MSHVNTRHNRIVRILAEFLYIYLQQNENWKIYVETQALHNGQELVPDNQLKYKFRNQFFIIDVKCAYDKEENMTLSDQQNLPKYQCIVDSAEDALPGWNIQVLTFGS